MYTGTGSLLIPEATYLYLKPVLWILNYFFRIRIPFSAKFWIRIQKK
jgi:hypothetical protein